MTASSGASQGRSRASTWTPRSRDGTPTCTWQPQVPESATTGPYRRASSRYRGWSVRAASPGDPVARLLTPPGCTPAALRRRRRAAGAWSARGRDCAGWCTPGSRYLAECGSPAGLAPEPGKGQRARSAVRLSGRVPRGRGYQGLSSHPGHWPGSRSPRAAVGWGHGVPEACEPVSCPVPVPWRAPACARVLPSAISSGPLSAARHPAEPVAAERVGRQRRRKCMGPRFGHNHDRAARAPRAGTRHRAGREPALGTRDRQRPAQDIPARSWQGAPLGEPGPDRAGDLGLPADPRTPDIGIKIMQGWA